MFLFSSLESISQQQEFSTLAVNEIISGEKPLKMFFSFLVVVFWRWNSKTASVFFRLLLLVFPLGSSQK